MKRYVSALAVALCLVSFSKSAVAASTQHELLINGSVGKLGTTAANVQIGNNLGGTNFGVGVGYLYSLHEMFQLGGAAELGYAEATVAGVTASTEVVNLKLLATVNFAMAQGGMQSVFIQGHAGWDQIQKSDRKFVWGAEVGMRYKLFENVTWRPTAGIVNYGGGIGFRAQLLAMSLQF